MTFQMKKDEFLSSKENNGSFTCLQANQNNVDVRCIRHEEMQTFLLSRQLLHVKINRIPF